MADDKKKGPPKKPEAPKPTGNQVIFEMVGVLIGIVILLSAIANFSLVKFFTSNTGGSSDQTVLNGNYGFWRGVINSYQGGTFPPTGVIAVGSAGINKSLAQVRREPGGSVIGIQKKGEKFLVADGPVNMYGQRWWMVNYDNPPGGWVDERDITSKLYYYYLFNFIPITWGYLKIVSWILSIFFACVIIYSLIKEAGTPLYDESPRSESKASPKSALVAVAGGAPLNLPGSPGIEQVNEESARWKRVELLLKSHNASDWKQAVIEADVMLEEMLDKMGYPGVSIGDKLKSIEKNDFETLDKAWEAHKVRNRIAHDGGGYKLSYDEVARVIGLYHDVFKEFYWV